MTRSSAAKLSMMARIACAAGVACGIVLSWSSVARADECPIGSVEKTEDGQTWCEPTVCEADNQCPTGSICRPVPLCVEVGTLDAKPGAKTDAGAKLLARQRCGADKACPQNTTCSEKSRCITRAQADKAGLLTGSAASGAATSDGGSAASSEAPKKACGCDVVGMRGGELGAGALAAAGALAIAARRRRRRL